MIFSGLLFLSSNHFLGMNLSLFPWLCNQFVRTLEYARPICRVLYSNSSMTAVIVMAAGLAAQAFGSLAPARHGSDESNAGWRINKAREGRAREGRQRQGA